MASLNQHRSMATDRELFRTVRQAALNHARQLYHRLVRRLPHLLAVTLVVGAVQLVPPSSAPLPPLGALLRELAARARADAGLVAAAAAGLAAAACAYAASRPRPVYLVELAAYRPAPAHRATRAESVRHFARAGRFTDESVAFQTRMLERAGVGDATHFPASILAFPVDMSLRAAREESEAVVLGVVDGVLAAAAVRAADIGVVIVNSSLFSPTPSFTSLLVSRYGLRHDVVTHNLSGMGCSASIIAIDLAKHLLQVTAIYNTGLTYSYSAYAIFIWCNFTRPRRTGATDESDEHETNTYRFTKNMVETWTHACLPPIKMNTTTTTLLPFLTISMVR